MSTLSTLLEAIWKSAWKYIVGFASFPIAVRGSGLLLEDIRKRWQSASAAKRVISTQLDPLLKAADELQGKLRSLAEEDFRDFRSIVATNASGTDLVNLCSTPYLFAQFWGRFFEVVERHLSVLANLDKVAVGIAHVTTPFPAAIVERFGEEERSFGAPLFVTGPDVGDSQVEEGVHSVEILRGFEPDLGLVGRRAATRIEDDPGVGQLDVAGILRMITFSPRIPT